MAERLHLSRNTVNAALEQLALEGYLTRSRQGTQVAPLASCRQEAGQMPPVVLPERLQRLPAAMRRDSPTLAFTPGMPAVNYFPLPLWRRLMDNVLREDGSALLGYGEAAGDPLLREAIARHLALSRGIRCDIRQIVITEGALEGVNLCASLLTNPGDSVSPWRARWRCAKMGQAARCRRAPWCSGFAFSAAARYNTSSFGCLDVYTFIRIMTRASGLA